MNIIQFKPKDTDMETKHIYIKGVVSEGRMHRVNMTDELRDIIKGYVRDRINK